MISQVHSDLHDESSRCWIRFTVIVDLLAIESKKQPVSHTVVQLQMHALTKRLQITYSHDLGDQRQAVSYHIIINFMNIPTYQPPLIPRLPPPPPPTMVVLVIIPIIRVRTSLLSVLVSTYPAKQSAA